MGADRAWGARPWPPRARPTLEAREHVVEAGRGRHRRPNHMARARFVMLMLDQALARCARDRPRAWGPGAVSWSPHGAPPGVRHGAKRWAAKRPAHHDHIGKGALGFSNRPPQARPPLVGVVPGRAFSRGSAATSARRPSPGYCRRPRSWWRWTPRGHIGSAGCHSRRWRSCCSPGSRSRCCWCWRCRSCR